MHQQSAVVDWTWDWPRLLPAYEGMSRVTFRSLMANRYNFSFVTDTHVSCFISAVILGRKNASKLTWMKRQLLLDVFPFWFPKNWLTFSNNFCFLCLSPSVNSLWMLNLGEKCYNQNYLS